MSSVAGTRFRHLTRAARRHIPTIPASSKEQLRHHILNLIRSTMMENQEFFKPRDVNGLKKIPPYWYPYTTMTKQRWIGRELLEVVSTEFRDRSMEYYRYALESGVTTVNGKVAHPKTILRDGDRIENVVHRHEPPVTSTPVKILLHDKDRQFIVVDKPGSIPVHASGRYFRNSLNEILVNDFGFEKVYTVNRLDRLTSGLMIIPLNVERARQITSEFTAGTVRKEYISRVKGRFPSEKVICEEPMLTVDRQMGLNIVHPEGKSAKTVFDIIHYDENTDSSVVRCRPFTGRSHQIRVHLQFLGYPIANDPVYSELKIWGKNVGKGGIEVTPSEEREAPAPPEHLQEMVDGQGNPELLKPIGNGEVSIDSDTKRLPRETGEDIGMGSPVPLSKEAVGVITRLRNMKDEDEDWGRWRDVVFRVKGKLNPGNIVIKPPPPSNRRKRGGRAELVSTPYQAESTLPSGIATPEGVTPAEVANPQVFTHGTEIPRPGTSEGAPTLEPIPPTGPQITLEEAMKQAAEMEPAFDTMDKIESEHLYCPDCYLPLHSDPNPEKLYIFLHAIKYTTSLGEFSTEMPAWAAKDWTWDRS
ncbi:tRNA-pseudouridine synthase [Crepidotus variabilis]|uniref:tRNA-pseudouridine synthase n=1 Tax=Crepidotus variabilis TaxID=179855 RepID=A0A9P6EHI0_9AGAR|nr:tRNA-pseudouridine synthase [Crepidotus variabilis]